jgi:hypothetical protein
MKFDLQLDLNIKISSRGYIDNLNINNEEIICNILNIRTVTTHIIS